MQYRFVGLSLAALAPLLVLSYACNCGGDEPPRRAECSTPDDDAIVTSMRVTGEHVFGFQGGQHVQARVFVEGSGLGSCTNFEAWIEGPGGAPTPITPRAIPLAASDTRTRSTEIYFYVDSSPSADERIAVTMLGQTEYSACVGSFCADGGPEGFDAGSEDGGTTDSDSGSERDAAATEDDGGTEEDGGSADVDAAAG
jgi:hypothetical protein